MATVMQRWSSLQSLQPWGGGSVELSPRAAGGQCVACGGASWAEPLGSSPEGRRAPGGPDVPPREIFGTQEQVVVAWREMSWCVRERP